jgi:aryl-alcohol dehydrogenase-like predicted oxidoreductase
MVTDRSVRIAETVLQVANETGRTAPQVALSWVRRQPFGVIVPILGAKTVAQLRDNLGCLDFTLAPDQLARLDAASRIELGFPHDFLVSARSYIFGKTFPLIDNHRS